MLYCARLSPRKCFKRKLAWPAHYMFHVTALGSKQSGMITFKHGHVMYFSLIFHRNFTSNLQTPLTLQKWSIKCLRTKQLFTNHDPFVLLCEWNKPLSVKDISMTHQSNTKAIYTLWRHYDIPFVIHAVYITKQKCHQINTWITDWPQGRRSEPSPRLTSEKDQHCNSRSTSFYNRLISAVSGSAKLVDLERICRSLMYKSGN